MPPTPVLGDALNISPDFIDVGYGPTYNDPAAIRSQCSKLVQILRLEQSILKRLPEHARPVQIIRIEAINEMIEEGHAYLNRLINTEEVE